MDHASLPKILYIDDTPIARLLVRRLCAHDFILLEASDPLTGIELAQEARPDLVLIDINLPELSGREVATRLRSLLPDTPLVALTADTAPGSRERALAAGCVGYMNKPIDIDTFVDEIKEYLAGKRESLPNAQAYSLVYQAELVERLENKVRELTKALERNTFLNEQNELMIVVLKRRQRWLEASARVAHSITAILNLDSLLDSTVDTICEEFGFYYAAIFLIDQTGEWAQLRSGRGQSGRDMVAEDHRLALDGSSLVAAAILKRQAQVVSDVDRAMRRTANPRLARTRSEIALPLIAKDKVLGGLSVQSDQVNAFEADDLTALQTLADGVAIAIQNAQLLRELDQANRELLRNKTFEAIAAATGEAIHWVGNKAAPIPTSVERIREDLFDLLSALFTLLQVPPEARPQHRLWLYAQAALDTLANHHIDPYALARQLANTPARSPVALGGLESMLEDLEIIASSANTILSIKEDLIGPVRLQKECEISAFDLINQTVFQMGLPAGVVEIQVETGLPPIWGDPRQLGQVLNNLVKNAWEALHNSQPGHPAAHIIIRALPAHETGFIQFQVEDNGPGIPPEILDKIWVSFFTTKGTRGGTGLGLSACMQIVHQAGGKIWVHSQPGKGTVFFFQIPAAPQQQNSMQPSLAA